MAAALRSLINQYAGANASNVGIAVTEANADAYKDTAPNGLFAPGEYLTWWEHGAFNLSWWNLHNGTDCSSVTTVDPASDYDDGGILSSGASCEPSDQATATVASLLPWIWALRRRSIAATTAAYGPYRFTRSPSPCPAGWRGRSLRWASCRCGSP